MTQFLVRIELIDANALNYEALHIAMATRGFKRTIQGVDLREFKLPPAEYLYLGVLETSEIVLEYASNAARQVGVVFRVLVGKFDDVRWANLEPVPPPTSFSDIFGGNPPPQTSAYLPWMTRGT